MRPFITIITEANRIKPRSKTIDTSEFAGQITALMRQFATLSEASIRFQRVWADQARQQLTAAWAKWESEPDNGPFDARESLAEIIDKIWQHRRDGLISVRRNAAEAEQAYQQRAAERHDREDDPDFWIEASDYLRGTAAMVQCALELNQAWPLSDPRVAQRVIMGCNRFVEDWNQHATPSDGGEAPLLDEDFVAVIERLLPLLRLLFSRPAA